MITIENLVVSYNKRQNVINSLNLKLSKKTIHGIVGLNGAGKSNLLNAIYGLKSIDSGVIKSENKKMSKKEIAYLVSENYFYSLLESTLRCLKTQTLILTNGTSCFYCHLTLLLIIIQLV